MERLQKLSKSWKDESYVQRYYKVQPCKNTGCWKDYMCPNYHGWMDRRREEEIFKTTGCRHAWVEGHWTDPKGQCPNGDDCLFAHSRIEMQYHTKKYKTQICRDYALAPDKCTRSVFCAFRHDKTPPKSRLVQRCESEPLPSRAPNKSPNQLKPKISERAKSAFGSYSYASVAALSLTTTKPPRGNPWSQSAKSLPSTSDLKAKTSTGKIPGLPVRPPWTLTFVRGQQRDAPEVKGAISSGASSTASSGKSTPLFDDMPKLSLAEELPKLSLAEKAPKAWGRAEHCRVIKRSSCDNPWSRSNDVTPEILSRRSSFPVMTLPSTSMSSMTLPSTSMSSMTLPSSSMSSTPLNTKLPLNVQKPEPKQNPVTVQPAERKHSMLPLWMGLTGQELEKWSSDEVLDAKYLVNYAKPEVKNEAHSDPRTHNLLFQDANRKIAENSALTLFHGSSEEIGPWEAALLQRKSYNSFPTSTLF